MFSSKPPKLLNFLILPRDAVRIIRNDPVHAPLLQSLHNRGFFVDRPGNDLHALLMDGFDQGPGRQLIIRADDLRANPSASITVSVSKGCSSRQARTNPASSCRSSRRMRGSKDWRQLRSEIPKDRTSSRTNLENSAGGGV